MTNSTTDHAQNHTTTDTAAMPATDTSDTSHPPLVADWMRGGELGTTVRRTSRRWRHTLVRHLLWLPVYVARLLKWSPRGVGRSVAWLWRAMLDEETRGLQRHHAGQRETEVWLRLEQARKDRIRNRQIAFGAIIAMIGIGIAIVWLLVSPALFWAVSVLVLLVLGWAGRPRDKRLLNAVPLVDGAPPPVSAPMVREALCTLGIAGMKDAESIGLLHDVARTTGGYQVGLELPAGVTAGKVIEKRPQLSAALRRELGTVWPTRGKRHEAHLELYVADEPVSTARQRPWPLMSKGQVNVFDAVPMFTDQRGHWVALTLAYTSGVIGGLPRTGKTFVMRQLGLVFALDPRTIIYAYDLKGTGDFGPLSLVAHGYGVGDEPEDIETQLAQMRDLHKEMRRRIKVIRKIAEENRALCPENKVNDQIANMRQLNLGPILLLTDEVQVWMEHSSKTIRDEFIYICTDLVKRGPAVGIHSYFGTQKPDANSIPTAISANAVVRFCLKVMGWGANDSILGTGAYNSGIDATVFAYEDKGLGYLRAEGAEAQIVRSVYGLDGVRSEKIALRARAVREAQGRLTGYAAGEDITDTLQQVDFLADCRQVIGNADAIHLADLADGLAALRQQTYGALNARSVGAMLREIGIEPRVVWDPAKPREVASGQGVTRRQLHVSATDADGDEDARDTEFEAMVSAERAS